MADGRFRGYTSFFSERIANTTSSVAQLVSVKNVAGIKSSITHQYAKCHSNLKELATSNAVTQIKDNLGSCKQVALTGYGKAKVSVSEVIESELVQSAATTLKENAIYGHSVAKSGSDKFKKSITQAIGHEKVDRINQQYDKYTESITDNYTFTKEKLSKFMESDEILRIKSIFDGSMNAVLSANLLFDLGLRLVPGTDSYNFELQCSKYLIACIVFVISASKSYDIRKKDHTTHEHMGLYQSQIEEAYDIAAQLQKVLSHIENLLRANYGQTIELPSISSKDFDAIKGDFVCQAKKADLIDFNVFIKALLDGATKSNWVRYLIKLISLSLPVMSSFNVLFVMTALVYTTMLALHKYQLRAHDEATIDLLQHQLEPIYAMLQHIENKLYSDPGYQQGILDHEIKPSFSDLSNKSSFEVDINAITEGVAKTSGLYFVLQTMLRSHSHFNYLICLVSLCVEVYDLHTSKQKQQNLDSSFKDLESRMENLVEMIEKMKNLLVKQGNYEKYLVESNKAREDFRKIAETCKLEMLRKANEERQQGELIELEAARQEELRKAEVVRQEELEKLEAVRQEELRKVEIARQEEHEQLETAHQQEFIKLEEARKQEELRKLIETRQQKELIREEVSHLQQQEVLQPSKLTHLLPQEIIEDKNNVNQELKFAKDTKRVEMQPYPFVTDLSLLKEEQDAIAIQITPHLKRSYIPAAIGGLTGAGIGWLLGICLVTFLSVPTLGLSLVVPAICAFIAGAIGFALAYWASNSSCSDSSSMKKNGNLGNDELTTRQPRKKISTLFCRGNRPVVSESSFSPSRLLCV